MGIIKINFNRNFFSKINTQEKAYWLGFMYADGCNQPEFTRASIQLAISDIDHLKKFCAYFFKSFSILSDINKSMFSIIF